MRKGFDVGEEYLALSLRGAKRRGNLESGLPRFSERKSRNDRQFLILHS